MSRLQAAPSISPDAVVLVFFCLLVIFLAVGTLIHRPLRKTVLRLWRGRGELETVLATLPQTEASLPADVLSIADFEQVVHDMKSSKVLKDVLKGVLRGKAPFDVSVVAAGVVGHKLWAPQIAGFQLALGRLNAVLYALNGAAVARMTLRAMGGVVVGPAHAPHVERLRNIWQTLRPETPCPALKTAPSSRPMPTKAPLQLKDSSDETASDPQLWLDIGFQGPDPWKDFRTGAFALQQLHAYATSQTAEARDLVDRTSVPTVGLPLALLSMAVSQWLQQLIQDARITPWVFTPVGLLWEMSMQPLKNNASVLGRRVGGGNTLKRSAYPPQALLYKAESGVGGAVGAASRTAPGGGHETRELVEAGIPCTQGEELFLVSMNAVHADVMREFVAHWWQQAPENMLAFERVWGSWRTARGDALVQASLQAFATQIMGTHATRSGRSAPEEGATAEAGIGSVFALPNQA